MYDSNLTNYFILTKKAFIDKTVIGTSGPSLDPRYEVSRITQPLYCWSTVTCIKDE